MVAPTLRSVRTRRGARASGTAGLDISANIIARAQERFSDPRARFVLYDGFHIPFPDDNFPVLYSVAAMQHIEKHIALLLFDELFVLSPR